MAREGCTDEEAFRMLVAASQRLNVKLREIAQLVVDDAGAESETR
jgi:AmiR/NasT family two-component response regulator